MSFHYLTRFSILPSSSYTSHVAGFSKKIFAANVFGTFGYFSCILSWGWVALLYLPLALENKIVEDFLLPMPAEEVARQPIVTESSPFMMVIALIVTVVVIVATIIILIRIPVALAKTGKTITTKAAESAVPIVTRHQPVPVAKKKLLTANLIKLVKLLLVVTPIGAALLGSFFELPLPYEVVIIVSGVLSFFSLLWFSLQYGLAYSFKLDLKNLV